MSFHCTHQFLLNREEFECIGIISKLNTESMLASKPLLDYIDYNDKFQNLLIDWLKIIINQLDRYTCLIDHLFTIPENFRQIIEKLVWNKWMTHYYC